MYSKTLNLETVLKRRNVKLLEWLLYHEITSLQDLPEKAITAAESLGCYITAELMQELRVTLKEHLRAQFKELSELAGQPEETMLAVGNESENKKKKINKKTNLKNIQDEVVLDVTIDPITDKEI